MQVLVIITQVYYEYYYDEDGNLAATARGVPEFHYIPDSDLSGGSYHPTRPSAGGSYGNGAGISLGVAAGGGSPNGINPSSPTQDDDDGDPTRSAEAFEKYMIDKSYEWGETYGPTFGVSWSGLASTGSWTFFEGEKWCVTPTVVGASVDIYLFRTGSDNNIWIGERNFSVNITFLGALPVPNGVHLGAGIGLPFGADFIKP